uniref:Basic leucine zipper ATF-like transcription factor 2 n=1 Tax=Astyanax mexicanus TaxID=7994 RepID=A0A3B1JX73_ASTMX
MPVALMDKLEGGSSSVCGSDSQSPRDWRRQRNRDAARRSRKKQTERADVLHETQELQALEQSNAAFVKEIDDLKKELQHYHTVLKEHEPHCTVHCLSQPSVPFTASIPSTFTTDMTPSLFNPSPVQDLPLPPSSIPESEISLADLLDRADWLPWD